MYIQVDRRWLDLCAVRLLSLRSSSACSAFGVWEILLKKMSSTYASTSIVSYKFNITLSAKLRTVIVDVVRGNYFYFFFFLYIILLLSFDRSICNYFNYKLIVSWSKFSWLVVFYRLIKYSYRSIAIIIFNFKLIVNWLKIFLSLNTSVLIMNFFST